MARKGGNAKKGENGNKKKGRAPPDPNPQPLKAAKFSSTDDDNYCSNMCVLIGPKKKPPLFEILLTVLGLGPQFRGYDMVDYALPMAQDDIQELHQQMVTNDWKLPSYNIRAGNSQGIYRQRTEQAYRTWLTKRAGTKNLNKHHIDVHDVAAVEWSVVQSLLSSALQFFRDVWILNPTKSKQQVYKDAIKIMRKHVKTKAQRRSFFKRHIAEKRQKLAHSALDEMKGLLVEDKFPDPIQACQDIRAILGHLGLSAKGSDRKCFERIQGWYTKIPMAFTELIDRFDWLDPEGDLVLQETPDETAARLEKEKEDEEELAARLEKEKEEKDRLEKETAARLEKEKEEKDRREKERTNIAAAALLDVGTVRTNETVEATNETVGATSNNSNQNSSSDHAAAKPSNEGDRERNKGTGEEKKQEEELDQHSSSDHAAVPAKPSNDGDRENEGTGEEKKQDDEVDTHDITAGKKDDHEETDKQEKEPDFVEIIDLTVDDLKPFQYEMDQKAGKMVATLSSESLAVGAPKPLKKGEGGRIKYSAPKPDWKASKTWEFTQIQVLVNVLTTLYGMKLPPRTSEKDRMIRVTRCANKLGFFVTGTVPAKKANIQAHVEQWSPVCLRSSFIAYLDILEALLSPAVNVEDTVRKRYKLAKSALVNGNSFSPYAAATLQEVIKSVVAIELEAFAAKKTRATTK